MAAMKAGVYRIWGEDGSLLYVGTSATPLTRIAAHRSRDWWTLVARIEIKSYESAAEARQAEYAAIRLERPIFNLSGRHRHLPVADGMWWSTRRPVIIDCPNCGTRSEDRPWAMTYRPDISIADDLNLAQSVPGPSGWQTSGWVIWVGCNALCHPFAMRPADAEEIIGLGRSGGGWKEF